jgi:hypothetical protein
LLRERYRRGADAHEPGAEHMNESEANVSKKTHRLSNSYRAT